MPTVVICRDALIDSILGNLALARTLATTGDRVDVLFTGEALCALQSGTLRWSPNFKTRSAQAGIIANAEAMNLPLAHPELDPRWSDARHLIGALKDTPGIRLLACPIWIQLLGIEGPIESLDSLDEQQLAALIGTADRIIGAY